ncbi:MerR family transcriptional regulator, partial [Vibrio parahaemolyticus]
MNMKEFSSAVGLSSYTLRYYEKIGLLKHVHRNSSGHR